MGRHWFVNLEETSTRPLYEIALQELNPGFVTLSSKDSLNQASSVLALSDYSSNVNTEEAVITLRIR